MNWKTLQTQMQVHNACHKFVLVSWIEFWTLIVVYRIFRSNWVYDIYFSFALNDRCKLKGRPLVSLQFKSHEVNNKFPLWLIIFSSKVVQYVVILNFEWILRSIKFTEIMLEVRLSLKGGIEMTFNWFKPMHVYIY